jgi:hypothetical protein
MRDVAGMRNLWSSFSKKITQSATDNLLNAFWGMVGGAISAAWSGVVIGAIFAAVAYLRGVDHKWVDRALSACVAFALVAVVGTLQAMVRRRRSRPLSISPQDKFLKFPQHTSLGQLSEHWADMEHGWARTTEAYQDLVETWNIAIRAIIETHSKYGGRADRETLMEQVKQVEVDKLWRSAHALKDRARSFAHLMEYFEDV